MPAPRCPRQAPAAPHTCCWFARSARSRGALLGEVLSRRSHPGPASASHRTDSRSTPCALPFARYAHAPPGPLHAGPGPRSLYALREHDFRSIRSSGAPSPPEITGPGGPWGRAQALELPRCRLPVAGTGLMLQPSRGLCYADLDPRSDRAFEPRGGSWEPVRMNHRPPGHVLINTSRILKEEKPRAGTFSAWLDVDPGTTARRAREEAT